MSGTADASAPTPYPGPVKRLSTLLALGSLVVATLGMGIGLAQGATPAGGGAATGGSQPAFADVPPCHWAAKAVARVAHLGIFVGFPPNPSYLSVNALRQVFEGLKCGDPSWSQRFLTGTPAAFPPAGAPTLAGFELHTQIVSLSRTRARLAFRLTARVDQNGAQHTLRREGDITATNTSAGWRVPYADLTKLGLPFFPG